MIGRTAWGALTGSGPAVRGGCRAFEFVSLAGVHSAPNTPSPGIALEIGSCGAGLFRRELVSPCWALPRGPARGGRCVSAGRRTLIEFRKLACVDVASGRKDGRRIDTGVRPFPFVISGPLGVARENLTLTNPLQPGSDRIREGGEVLPCVVGIHSQRMEQADGKFFGTEYAQK